MKPLLILITSAFPYGKAETFLEAEVAFLSAHFELILAPMRKSATSRTLPVGVRIDKSLAEIFDKPNRKFVSLFSLPFYRSLFHHIRYALNIQALKRINTYNTEYRAVRKWLLATAPTDCVVYSYWLNGAALAAAEYAHQSFQKVRAVSRLHGYDAYTYLYNPPFFPYRTRVLELIDRLFPVSNAAAAELSQQGADRSKVCVSRLGVADHAILTVASEDPQNSVRIVSVSNIYPVKRVDLIARTMISLAKLRPSLNIEWVHFGEGHLKESVLNLIESEDLLNLVCQLRGQVSNAAIFDFYKRNSVDAFLNLSRSEGIPVSIMEALSCGVPVVATRVGGTEEIVVHKQNGYLLPANPPLEEVVAGILYVFQHYSEPVTREGIRTQWKKEFSAEKAYGEFCAQLQRLVIS